MVRVGQPATHATPRDEPGTGDRGFCAQIARPERGPETGPRAPPQPRPAPSQVGARHLREAGGAAPGRLQEGTLLSPS